MSQLCQIAACTCLEVCERLIWNQATEWAVHFYFSQSLLDEYSRLLQRLAAVDSRDCSSKMSFYTATLHRALQKKSSNDHLSVFNHGQSNCSLDHALDESGTWQSVASNLSEEDPDPLTSSMTSLPLRRMTRSRSLDDMLDTDSRHRRVLKKTTSLKRRVGSSKFYTEQILNAKNKGRSMLFISNWALFPCLRSLI